MRVLVAYIIDTSEQQSYRFSKAYRFHSAGALYNVYLNKKERRSLMPL